MRRPSAKSCAVLNVTAASQELVAENPSRRQLIIGIPAADIHIKLRVAAGVGSPDPTATLTDFVIKSTRTEEFVLDSYTGPVAFIASAPTTVPVIEI